MPPAFYLAVNISLIWIAAPIAALLKRKHPLVGFIFYGLLITNGITHVAPMILGRGYSPGTLSAILLFFPGFFWTAHACFGPGRISYKGLAVIVASGDACHSDRIHAIASMERSVVRCWFRSRSSTPFCSTGSWMAERRVVSSIWPFPLGIH